jgi:toxin YoeB
MLGEAGLVMWRVVFTKQAQKDAKKLASAGLRSKAEKLLDILRENPYKTPPTLEKLLGDLSGAYSRRINIQHRLVYQILDNEKVVKVIRMWTHYK